MSNLRQLVVKNLFGEVVELERDKRKEWEQAFGEDFWPNYPRKVGRQPALKAWLSVEPWNEVTRDRICNGLDRWRIYWEHASTEKQFIPHAATWIRQRRYEEEPE